jgi:predicted HAD superfamily Cof-like phosphohydrolase
MKEAINKVQLFHDTFKIINNNTPQLIGSKGYQLRYDLALEELDEYKKACQDGNLIEIADSLGDQLYILLGTILRHGMQDIIEDVFNEIHASNMSKLDDEGLPIFREDGKILKSHNYFKPNIQKIFDSHYEIKETAFLTKDEIFKQCVMLFANLGKESTAEEKAEAYRKEAELLEQLKYIDPEEYEFFMSLNKK